MPSSSRGNPQKVDAELAGSTLCIDAALRGVQENASSCHDCNIA
jgi:hypothetical protein